MYAEAHNYALGIFIATVATFCFSITQVTTRMLKEINFAVIQFTYAVTAVFFLGICVFAEHLSSGLGTYFVYKSWTTYLEILAVAVLNFISQNCVTYTNQNAKPTNVSLMMYIGVVYSFFIDKFLFNHVFSGLELAGVMTCLACSVACATYRWSLQQQDKPSSTDDEFAQLKSNK